MSEENPDDRIDEHLIMLVKDGEGPHDFFVACKCGERFVLWRDHSESIDLPQIPARVSIPAEPNSHPEKP